MAIKDTETTCTTQLIEHSEIGVEIVQVVAVRGIVRQVPLEWWRVLAHQAVLQLALIVHAVHTHQVAQEAVQFGVLGGVDSDLEQRLENICNVMLLDSSN